MEEVVIRSQVYFNRKTGAISFSPGWPPVPSEGDHWIKPVSKRRRSYEKHLERKVLEIHGCRLKYEDQSGQVKKCSKDAFHKWTDDCRAHPKKLAGYKISKTECSECVGTGLAERVGAKKKVTQVFCWRCNGEGQVPLLTPKKRKPAKKRARA